MLFAVSFAFDRAPATWRRYSVPESSVGTRTAQSSISPRSSPSSLSQRSFMRHASVSCTSCIPSRS